VFVIKKGNHRVGIYLAGAYKTMLPKNDPQAVYQVPDSDGAVVVKAGLYDEVAPEKVTTFFALDNPSKAQDAIDWTWQQQTV
jgi:hypothetical protein